jgi:hypothetical protein
MGMSLSSELEESIADKGSDVRGERATSRLVEEDPVQMSLNSVDGWPESHIGIFSQ